MLCHIRLGVERFEANRASVAEVIMSVDVFHKATSLLKFSARNGI